MDSVVMSIVTAGIVLCLPAACAAIGQTKAISAALDGIARQPEASNKIGTSLIIGLAFIESLVIYGLVLALLLLFANPFTKATVKIEQAKAELEILKDQVQEAEIQNRLKSMDKAQ